MADAKFRYVGDHAQDFPGGTVAGPGDFVHLNKKEQEHPIVQDLLASGKLVGTGAASEDAVEAAEDNVAKKEAAK